MNKYKKLIAGILVAVFIFTNTFSSLINVYAAPKEKVKKKNKVEILVKYRDSAKITQTNTKVKSKLKLKGFEKKSKMKYVPIEIYEINEADDIDSVVKELSADPNVEYAQPNYELFAAEEIQITDARFKEQWGLSNVGQIIDLRQGIAGVDTNAVNAWQITEGSEAVVVAVLDTGIDISHPDLKNNIYVNKNEIPNNGIDDDGNGYIDDVNGWDFANNDKTVYDSSTQDKHGTHIAGIIAAEANLQGIRGIAPKVKIMPLKFLNGNTGYTSDVIEAIEYAKMMGIKVINASFGGANENFALMDAIASSDILFVCAAGNNGLDIAANPIYPAAFDLPNIISVAAIDNAGSLASFSNYGSKVHIAAPGVNILSTIPNNGYAYMNGTSMAAPYVTGTSALVLSHLSGITAIELAERIKNSASETEKLKDKVITNGIINAHKALIIVIDGSQDEDIYSKSRTQILVKLKDAVFSEEIKTEIKEKLNLTKLETVKRLKSNQIEVWEIAANDNIDAVVSELMTNPSIEYAHPNYAFETYEDVPEGGDDGTGGDGSTGDGSEDEAVSENLDELAALEAAVKEAIQDEAFDQQWSLYNTGQVIELSQGIADADINVLSAWRITEGTENTVVAVIDTGIDMNHIDLAANIYINKAEIPENGIDDDNNGYIDDVNGWDFFNNDNTVFDDKEKDKHGTYIAGVIAAEANEKGIRGIAPKVKILPLKFISGRIGYTSDLIETIEYAKTMGIKIANISFGSSKNNHALKEAMEAADMLFVCAAGNEGMDISINPVYPASFELPNIIAVAAFNNVGELTEESNYGSKVHLAAPGYKVLSTIPENKYSYMDGTSAAAAHVTGIAALVLSGVPKFTGIELTNRIKNSTKATDALADMVASNGIIDASLALALVSKEIEEQKKEDEANAYDAIMVSMAAEISPQLKEQIHYGENGVSPATGNYSTSSTDMEMSAPGFVVNISRTYNSKDERTASLMGRGWSFGFEGSLKQDPNNASLMIAKLPNGSIQVFVKNADGTYTANDSRSKLEKQADNTHILTTKDQYTYSFNTAGYITWMKDRKGNAINIQVDNASGKILSISDQVGRSFTVAYNQQNLIASVADPIGRTIRYEYENNLLVRAIDPMGNITHYSYDAQKYLTEIRDNQNNLTETIMYNHAAGENQHKVSALTDRYGNTFTYTYNNAEAKTIINDINGRAITKWYDTWFYIIKSQDPEGKQVTVGYYLDVNDVNKYGEEKAITDRYGNITQYLRDNNGNITKIINPDSSSREYSYDEKNNLITEKDELGNKTCYIYDESKIYLLKKVQPINGTDIYSEEAEQDKFAITSYTYYTEEEASGLGYAMKGMLKAETDPEGNTTTYTYDIYGNVKTITDPTGNIKTNSYNNIGWLTKTISAKGFKTEYQYNSNGLLEKQILNNGETYRTVYDSLGRKVKEVTPNLYKNAEDGLNLIPQLHSYDGDRGYRYSYYANGLLQAVKDPEGYETTYTYDVYGNKLTETKANGSIYVFEYDIMNRVKKVYFKNSSEDAQILSEEYQYNVQADGKQKKSHIRYLNDTEAAETIYVYDYADRLIQTQYADGGTEEKAYNANGTVNTQTYTNGSTQYYKYDGLNRLTEVWTPIEANKYSYSKNVYDKAGRIIEQSTGKDKLNLYEIPAQDRLITNKSEYYANGKLKASCNDDGRRTNLYYDSDGDLIREEKYTSLDKYTATEYTYNHLGKPLTKTIYARSGDIYGYDFSDNQLKAITTQFSYDKEGNLISLTTPDGISKSYTYNTMGKQLSESYAGQDENGLPKIIQTKTQYDWNGSIIKTTDAKGNAADYIYDQRNQLIKQISYLNGEPTTEIVTAYAYDRAGRKIAEVTPENYDAQKQSIFEMNRIQYTYDKMDRLKTKAYVGELKDYDEITGAWVDNNVETVLKAFKYDKSGNVVKELNGESYKNAVGATIDEKISAGYGIEYTYNMANQMIAMLDAVSKDRHLPFTVKYEYDGLGRKIIETNAKGAQTIYYYNDAGNIIRTSVRKSEEDIEQTLSTAAFDLAGRRIADTDALGNTTSYQYNEFGSIRKTILPGDNTIAVNAISYQYDAVGRLKKKQDTAGTVDLYSYDKSGRAISQVQQKADGTESIKTSKAYDVNGSLRFITDGNGNVTENIYDSLNRLIETRTYVTNVREERVLHTTRYSYDRSGCMIQQTDWLGNASTNVYDQLGRLIEKQDSYAVIQRLKYNLDNMQTSSYDAFNNVIRFDYDKNQRQIETTDQEGHKLKQGYDDIGKLSSKTDGSNNTTYYQYDYMGRLSAVIMPNYEKTTYTYDLNSNKLAQTDGNGSTTTFEYNAVNKVSKIINHGGRTDSPNGYIYDMAKVESYTYNPDGTISTVKDRNGIITTYTYDSHKRMLSKIAGSQKIEYIYDNNSNRLTMKDITGTTARVYDQLGRVIMKTVPDIGATTYEYDIIEGMEQGHTAEKIIDPKGNITIKIYDKAGRLQKVTADGQTTAYTYDGNGNRTSVVYDDNSKEEYTYYKNNLLKTLVNTKADNTIIDSYSYVYDNADNQISKTDAKGTTTYTYDSLNRLTKVIEPASLAGKVTAYTYDKAGNRLTEAVTEGSDTTTTAYVYNELNRLIKTSTKKPDGKEEKTTYTYDGNGNMLYKELEKLNPSQEGTVPSFSIFILGQTDNELGKYSTIFEYDVFNQLTATISGSKTTSYQYNGDGYRVLKASSGDITRYLYEYDKVVLEVDGRGSQIARNIYGLNLLSRTVEGQKLYYFYNGHADVTALMDTAGSIKASYYYDAFGNPRETTGTANNPYRYSGYQYDEETGNYYLNARYYDPKIARFMTEDTYRGEAVDPLSLNLYTYCINNPISYWDPTGHRVEYSGDTRIIRNNPEGGVNITTTGNGMATATGQNDLKTEIYTTYTSTPTSTVSTTKVTTVSDIIKTETTKTVTTSSLGNTTTTTISTNIVNGQKNTSEITRIESSVYVAASGSDLKEYNINESKFSDIENQTNNNDMINERFGKTKIKYAYTLNGTDLDQLIYLICERINNISERISNIQLASVPIINLFAELATATITAKLDKEIVRWSQVVSFLELYENDSINISVDYNSLDWNFHDDAINMGVVGKKAQKSVELDSFLISLSYMLWDLKDMIEEVLYEMENE